jgi:predicted membrane chloride channel (bestrophin family)
MVVNLFFRKWVNGLKVLPFAIGAVALKVIFHQLGWEILSLSPLLTGLIAASVFLLGFLISGVLSDYKEAEKIPGDLAANLESLFQEVSLVHQTRKNTTALECMEYVIKFNASLIDWFRKNTSTQNLQSRLTALNAFFLALGHSTEVSYIVRMKNDQSAIRRNVIRADVIRETTFVPSGYAIAEATIFVVTLGLWLTKMDFGFESLFLIGVIVFIFVYMMALIQNLENPFDYSSKWGVQDEVSLAPLENVDKRMKALLTSLKPQGRRRRR